MRKQNPVGFEIRDVVNADRDPREMSSEALGQAQHGHFPPVPMRTRKTGRQIAAPDFDGGLPLNDPDGGVLPGKPIGQGSRDVANHNIPSAFDCALWPFRMDTFPSRAPVSDARREHGRQMGLKMAAERSNPLTDNGNPSASSVRAPTLPEATPARFSKAAPSKVEDGVA